MREAGAAGFCLWRLCCCGYSPERRARFFCVRVVSDEKGEPMVGVTVLVKNTSIGRITGLKGEYRLEVPQNSVLVFSYMGYTTVEKHVGTQTQLNVTLTEQAQSINDVVVTALGIKREQKALG